MSSSQIHNVMKHTTWCMTKMQLGSSSFINHSLTDFPEGPGNDWSCVNLFLGVMHPNSSIVSWPINPNGATDANLNLWIHHRGRGRLWPWITSSSNSLRSISRSFSTEWWLPQVNMNLMSCFQSSNEISSNGGGHPIGEHLSYLIPKVVMMKERLQYDRISEFGSVQGGGP